MDVRYGWPRRSGVLVSLHLLDPLAGALRKCLTNGQRFRVGAGMSPL